MTMPRRKTTPLITPAPLPSLQLQPLPKGQSKDHDSLVAIAADMRLDDLVVTAATRAQLDQVLHEHAVAAELVAHGLAPAMRLLFEGPPGTGKTSAAGALALGLGLPLLVARQHELVGSFMGASATAITRLLEYAAKTRAVFLIDEIDGIAMSRMSDTTIAREENNRMVIAFLSAFDRPADPGAGIVIACTNRIDAIDPAVRRRFDLEVPFELPDASARRALVQRTMGGGGGLASGAIGDLFDGFEPPDTAQSHAAIVHACRAEKKRRVLAAIAARSRS